jgi:L-2-hydroxyglutarate oxidase LhgO
VDQQAALLAEGCLITGEAKCTYGTGAFLPALAGLGARRSGAGVRLLLRTHVLDVRPGPGQHEVRTSRGPLRCRWLINAAGLYSDQIDRMLGGGSFTITPRRGELIVFDKLARPTGPGDARMRRISVIRLTRRLT